LYLYPFWDGTTLSCVVFASLQELMENVADPKEFGKRGEPLFFGQLLLLTLIFFPPKFFTVTNPSADVHALHALHISSLGDICLSLSFYNIQTPISRQSHCFILYLIPLTKSHTAKCTYVEYCDSDALNCYLRCRHWSAPLVWFPSSVDSSLREFLQYALILAHTDCFHYAGCFVMQMQ